MEKLAQHKLQGLSVCLSGGSRTRELGAEKLLGKNFFCIQKIICENFPEKVTHPGAGDQLSTYACVISLFPYCVS